MKPLKAVVMGGGSGTYPVISALKKLNCDIATIICVSDSGGSTGRIRDEFGFPPVGDLRQSLASLAESQGEEWIRKILLYRFSKGEGLRGHNLGNLILTALQDMTGGDTTQALEIVEKIFRLEGRVIPVTKENVHLKINYEDGSSFLGEHILDEKADHPKRVVSVELTPHGELNPQAAQAIEQADVIIIGPGDYFASIMAVLVAKGIPEAFARSKAKVIYNMNLMTRLTQTPDMTAQQHVAGIEHEVGRTVDFVVVNNSPIPSQMVELYAKEQEFPVKDDLGSDPRIIREDVISGEMVAKVAYDTAHRSLLRHDSEKLITVFQKILRV